MLIALIKSKALSQEGASCASIKAIATNGVSCWRNWDGATAQHMEQQRPPARSPGKAPLRWTRAVALLGRICSAGSLKIHKNLQLCSNYNTAKTQKVGGGTQK